MPRKAFGPLDSKTKSFKPNMDVRGSTQSSPEKETKFNVNFLDS